MDNEMSFFICIKRVYGSSGSVEDSLMKINHIIRRLFYWISNDPQLHNVLAFNCDLKTQNCSVLIPISLLQCNKLHFDESELSKDNVQNQGEKKTARKLANKKERKHWKNVGQSNKPLGKLLCVWD